MKIAFLAFDGCALWQVAKLLMVMQQAGTVIRTLTQHGDPVMSDSGLRLGADASIEQSAPRDYDWVLMAGGDVTKDLAEDPRVQRFLRQFTGQGGLVAASCASSMFLGAAGLLGGLHFTSMPGVVAEHPEYFSKSIFDDTDVSMDGNIITSKGYAYDEFARTVCRRIGIPLNRREII